ncbi:MAG TPA: DnaJ domain-containing protein [Stellaceae bacterium]|nr:DnaJ domain-containing protein [Stellaceae bacterium]
MLFLLGGILLLCGLLLAVYLFVNADAAQLARGLKWAGIGIAGLAVLALIFSGRLALILAPIAMLMPFLVRFKSLVDRWRPASSGRTSTVTTDFLRMSLEHDTGAMTGTVLRGQFAGMQLDELGPGELLSLLRECRAADERGARLLEAYLDRIHPTWRDEFIGDRGGAAAASGGEMSVEEAYQILGLAPGAGADLIREAHHRLMKKVHPDAGGSDYLATKINRARDVLLNRARA